MRRSVVLAGLLSMLVVTFAVTAQDTPQLAGTWDITINNPDRTINEQWVVMQDGGTLSGTVKTARGDLSLEGTVEGSVVRVQVTNGDMQYQIHATAVGDSMDGTIKMGKNEYLWRAKRAKSG